MKINEIRNMLKIEPGKMPTSPDQWFICMKEQGIDPASLYQEMEMSDRYVDVHRDSTASGGLVNLHSHSFYEILCCRNTCGVEYLVGTDRYLLQKGDIVIMAPGVSHRPILPEKMEESYQRDVIWMSPEFLENVKKACPEGETGLPERAALLRTAGTSWEFLAELFQVGVEESERRRPYWRSVVIGNALTLVAQLSRALASGDMKPMRAEKPELLDQVMEYVEKHLSDKLTLKDVARDFYVSESTISQTFRQKMGVSFYRCVTQRRLIAAKNLILEGIPLEQINEQVGFSDYSSFYRAFKQEYGISPRQFRQTSRRIGE
ncbi:MAG: helix-turn-helix domain-containing protein [Lachnospiraceae bacterium]|nr:helix-turn-helix domain-containing protein [Lachnospiraceae bacterium]